MTPQTVERYFTRHDGSFHFARWARPLAPVVFGTDDASLDPIKDAIRRVAALGDLAVVDTDPELGANVMIFVIADWEELRGIPHLDRLLPDLDALLDRLRQAGANQYRSFRFEDSGAIKLAVILLRLDEGLAELSAQTLATAQMVQSMLLWSDRAFVDESPVATVTDDGLTVAKPAIAALIRAAYDPVLPHSSRDPALALRLGARAGLLLGESAVPETGA